MLPPAVRPWSCCLEKELLVRGQTGGVRQQHAHRHLAAPRIAAGKLRHDAGHRRLQINEPALVQNHRHSGGRDNFRNRSQIEDGGHGHGRRFGLVSESPKGFQRDQLSLIGYRDRSGGKRRPGDASCRMRRRGQRSHPAPDMREQGSGARLVFRYSPRQDSWTKV